MQNFYTKESPFLTKHERGNKWWFHRNHKTHLGAFQDVVDEIKNVISKDARVFALSDPSPNGHLVLLQRKGYTGYAINQMPGSVGERLDSLGIQESDVVVCYADYDRIEEVNSEEYSLIFSNEFVKVWERE